MQIPDHADIVIAGGSAAAVCAAQAAREAGASVLLLTGFPYLGEELCATLMLDPEPGGLPDHPLARQLFGRGRPTPLQIKQALDRATIDARADVVFAARITRVAVAADGRIAGIELATRAGTRQVRTGCVIDATPHAWVARLTGAATTPWPAGELTFTRTTITGTGKDAPRWQRQTLSLPMPDRRWPTFAAAEQEARDRTFVAGQLRASDCLHCLPPDPIRCRRSSADWQADIAVDPAHFHAQGLTDLFVISACADVPRPVAEAALRPGGMMDWGAAVGTQAAQAVRTRPGRPPVDLTFPAEPRLGSYDVVIAGGGTAGAAAAIAALRAGASVLLVEALHGLGGTGTLGLIGRPYHGAKRGFAAEVPFPDATTTVEDKMEWYRRQIRALGGVLWFGATAFGVTKTGDRVTGVRVATPAGSVVVGARVVVDTSGNADLAAATGAIRMYGATEAGDIALQGSGLPVRPLG